MKNAASDAKKNYAYANQMKQQQLYTGSGKNINMQATAVHNPGAL